MTEPKLSPAFRVLLWDFERASLAYDLAILVDPAAGAAGAGRLLGRSPLALMTAPRKAASKKAHLARAFLRGEPVHCTWQLSPRCDAFCHLCEHRAESSGDELDTAACAAVAAELGRSASLLVSFTGSEPFLRSDLPEIVRATARFHFPLLVTNGCLVSPPRAREVWQAGLEVATVALEDGLAERHDAVTGLPGSHARALAALATLARERSRGTQRVNVRVRLRGADLGPLERVLAVAEAHGASVTVEGTVPLPVLDRDSAVALASGLRRAEAHVTRTCAAPSATSRASARRSRAASRDASRAAPSSTSTTAAGSASASSTAARRTGSVACRAGRSRSSCRCCASATPSNDCRDCWYASRAEVEGLYTLRGFLSGLATLVRA